MSIHEVLDFITPIAPIVPVAALIVSACRLIPVVITLTKSKSRSRNPSHRTLRVSFIQGDAPWNESSWPRDWDSDEGRANYRKSERRGIVLLFSSSLLAAVFYGSVVYDDFWGDIYSFRAGNGIPASLACALFVAICIVQGWYWTKTKTKEALDKTMYGASATTIVQGSHADVRQYCLGSLYELGSKIVSCRTCEPVGGCPRSTIEAATGVWPRLALLNKGFLKLMSFRGQKIAVTIQSLSDGATRVEITSDNENPGVDEGYRANRRNVQAFVDSWAFFPDQVVASGSADR
jgi:hypothetical protein